MSSRVTGPGVFFVVVLILLLLLFIPFVFLEDWDVAWGYSTAPSALLSGWLLREWHNEALRKKISTRRNT